MPSVDGSEFMNKHVRSRIRAIQASLLATYRGGVGMPTAMVGGERELVLHGLFREVLPPIYRFGQGAITDATGYLTGQVDLVMELPFGPSLPMPAGSHRLYLAESVLAIVDPEPSTALGFVGRRRNARTPPSPGGARFMVRTRATGRDGACNCDGRSC